MSLTKKGFEVLDKGTSIYAISRSQNLPCCTLVAMWILDVAHDVEANHVSTSGGKGQMFMMARSPGRPLTLQRINLVATMFMSTWLAMTKMLRL